MARLTGRTGQVYIDQSSAGNGSATSVAYAAKWELNSSAENIDVTAFGDTTRVYVQGLPDAKGTITGFYDDTATTGSTALFTMGASGVARKIYLYPKTPSTSGPYFFGTAFCSAVLGADANAANTISIDYAAATSFAAVG